MTSTQCHLQCYVIGQGYQYMKYPSTEYNALEISFDEFVKDSINIRRAYLAGICSEISDLQFPSTGCISPKCKCNKKSIGNIKYAEIDKFFEKECIECTCGADGYSCIETENVYDPKHYLSFDCPQSVTCIDGSDTYRAAEAWFWSQNCTTFCYCSQDGNTYCAEDFVAIMNHENAELTQAFVNRCGSALGDVK